MEDIFDLTKKLEHILEQENVNIIKMFNDGVNQEYLKNIMGEKILVLPDCVYELYNWKNGVPVSEVKIGESALFNHSIFIPFEYSWISYRYFSTKSYYLNGKDYFPLFFDGGGVYCLIDINKTSENYKTIYEYDVSAIDHENFISKYDSIECLLKSVIECFLNGVYKFQLETKMIEVDYEKETQIFRKYNPKSKYWTLI